MSDSSKLYLCWTTTANRDDAQLLANAAVKAELAACAQIDGPIASVYSWNGELHSDPEFRLCFKALEPQIEALEKLVHESHPYDTPEWVCIPAEKVSEKYLKWAEEVSNLRGFP